MEDEFELVDDSEDEGIHDEHTRNNIQPYQNLGSQILLTDPNSAVIDRWRAIVKHQRRVRHLRQIGSCLSELFAYHKARGRAEDKAVR